MMADQIYKVRDPSGAIREIRGPAGASDEEVIARAQELFSSAPAPEATPQAQPPQGPLGLMQQHGLPTPFSPQGRGGAVMQNAAREAIAGIPDMFLNAPSNLQNLGKAYAGTLAHAVGRSDLAPNIEEAPNLTRNAFQKMGWLNQENEPQTSGERALAAGTGGAVAGAMGGGVPSMLAGGASNLVGQQTGEATGSPELGIIASLLASKGGNVAKGWGDKKVALAKELKSQKQPMIDTMNEVREAGYSIPPATTNPTMFNKVLESFGGKTATAQDASMRGNEVTAALVRKELGLPPSAGLTSEALDKLAASKAGPYRDMATLAGLPAPQTGTKLAAGGLGPVVPTYGKTPTPPAEILETLKKTRENMFGWWRESQSNLPGATAAREKYFSALDKTKELEQQLEAAAVAANRPEMVPALRKARQEIAKIHDVDRALNTDRGEVSAIDLAKARERGVPLSGGLETAAKMGNAYSKAIQDASKIGSPGTSNLNSMLGTGIGAGLGAWSDIPGGASLGAMSGMIATPVLQSMMRKLLLSKPYQRKFGTPNFDTSRTARTASKIPIASPDEALLRAYILSQQGQEP